MAVGNYDTCTIIDFDNADSVQSCKKLSTRQPVLETDFANQGMSKETQSSMPIFHYLLQL